MSIDTDNELQVEVRSDGNPFNTQVLVDGKPLGAVMAVHWDVDGGGSRMVVEFDWIGVHYEGPAMAHVQTPTAKDVTRFWWNGLRRRSRRLWRRSAK